MIDIFGFLTRNVLYKLYQLSNLVSRIYRYFGCFERKKRPSKDEDELAKAELEKFQVD